MTIPDAELQAYVDGELPPDRAARVEAAIAADVLVAARVERERTLRRHTRGTTVPPSGQGAVSRSGVLPTMHTDGGSPSGEQPARARIARWRTPLVALGAAAAAVAIASWVRAPSSDIAVARGGVVARGELARQLDRALTGAPDGRSSASIGLTFRAVDGHVCRGFTASASGVAGIACRDGDGWSVVMLTRLAGDPARGPADVPPELLAAMAARMQGGALDRAQERQARDAGWR
jgi:hypothetical protein